MIWLHAVSVGEVKAAEGLVLKIKAEEPSTFVLVTTVTASGLAEAKRTLSQVDAIRFMPLDFSWLVRKWVRILRPKLLLCIEGDGWPNLLRAVRKCGGKTALVSGKLSERSLYRFAKFPRLAKTFFSLFDLVLAQTTEYQNRFAPFVEPNKLRIGGNLKWDAKKSAVDLSRYEAVFGEMGLAVAVVSTHAPEEAELLDALEPLNATLFIAPRHPHRFQEVAGLLDARGIPYCLWSRPSANKRVVLVDAMGQLPLVFSLSHLAVVAGSFSSRVGGHNILEPCLYGIPVFFGPHMHTQAELVTRVLAAGAGRQAEASGLVDAISAHLRDPLPMRQGAKRLFEGAGGALETTWERVRVLCPVDEPLCGTKPPL